MTTLQSERWVSLISLFSSSGTLICCALPALLVSIGAGASLAGIISQFPQIVWLSEYKLIVFLISGTLILISLITTWLNRNAPCPIDPKQAQTCKTLRRWSRVSLFFAVIIYAIGTFFAFILPSLQG